MESEQPKNAQLRRRFDLSYLRSAVHADGRFALRILPSFAHQFRIRFSQITLSQFRVSHFADYS